MRELQPVSSYALAIGLDSDLERTAWHELCHELSHDLPPDLP